MGFSLTSHYLSELGELSFQILGVRKGFALLYSNQKVMTFLQESCRLSRVKIQKKAL